MGFLIFAYRKLSLKSKITDLQYRQMCLQNQKMTISDQISQRQQMFSSMKDQRESAMSLFMYQYNSSRAGQYLDRGGQSNGNPASVFGAMMNSSMPPEMMYEMAKNQMLGSLEDQRNNMDLQSLGRKDKEIERQMATIESQLKIMTQELESVEKAEDNAVKQDTPKFGLS